MSDVPPDQPVVPPDPPVVQVHLPRGAEPFSGGPRQFTASGGTVTDVVGEVVADRPALAGHLLDGRGAVRPHLVCVVDGEVTRDPSATVHRQLRFLLAVSGG